MKRFRRLRQSAAIRNLVQETTLTKHDLIQPFFVIEGNNKREEIESMPGIARYSVDLLLKEVEAYIKQGAQAGLFFGLPKKKNETAMGSYASNGIIQKAVKALKKEFPEFCVITDVCLCAYTSHGHCGIVKNKSVDNDKTVSILAKAALSHATAGADIVAPSDMMDFRVKAIRESLDSNSYENVPIMSYAVKYNSAFYGPFREAADSAPQFGDRKTYQMDPANSDEALREAKQDLKEGADFIMVKPALAYLDIVARLKQELAAPLVAYNVSGEYAMVKAAAIKKWVDEESVVLESLLAMKRAGANMIISYHASEALGWLTP